MLHSKINLSHTDTLRLRLLQSTSNNQISQQLETLRDSWEITLQMKDWQLQCKDQDQAQVEIRDQFRSSTLSYLQIILLLSNNNSNHSSSHKTKINSTPSSLAWEDAKGINRTSSNNNMLGLHNINSHLNTHQFRIGNSSLRCRDLLLSNLNWEDRVNMSSSKLNSRVLLSLSRTKTMVLDNSYQALSTQFSQLQMLCLGTREQEPLREKGR